MEGAEEVCSMWNKAVVKVYEAKKLMALASGARDREVPDCFDLLL